MQINAIKFRSNQGDEPITYKFSQSSGKFANFQSICAAPALLINIRSAIDFALTGKTTATIYDAVLQTSDHAGNTWIVHRTLSKIRLVKNGVEQREEQLADLHAAFFEHIDEVGGDDVGPTKPLTVGNKKIALNKGKLVAIDPDTENTSGSDVRGVLENQIATITAACVANTGLNELVDPGIMIKLSQEIEPLYASFREICSQYRTFKESKPSDAGAGVAELDLQLEIIRDLELLTEKFLTPNFSVNKAIEDLAVVDSKIAEMAEALNINAADTTTLIKDFRKPIEAIARLEMFAKLVRASQGSRKYCEQKIEPFYKKYLEFADRNLANNRQIAAELDSCLSTLALKLKTDPKSPRESNQSLKTWFEKFKSKSTVNEETELSSSQNAHNDFDTARLAIEYAVSQLNEMAGHLKIAVTQHESALGAVDDAHETLVAQYNQLRNHWVATAKASGISADIDSTHMIKIIIAHGKLASLIEHRNQLAQARKQQEQDFMQIEDLIVRWRTASGSQKSLDLSSPNIILREARDILRYKEARIRRRDQLRDTQNSRNATKVCLDHLKARREDIITQWDKAFHSYGMKAPSISDKYNRELMKRAAIIRGLALAWSSTPGIDPGVTPFSDHSGYGMVIYDTTTVKLAHSDRLEFLRIIESATGGELRLLLISDEQLSSLITALSIGTASRVVQAPAPVLNKSARPTPVAKIIRPEKNVRVQNTQEKLSERAQQMLEMLSPRK